MSQVAVVVPAEEELKIESNGCICTVEGCGKLFQTSSQLQMHLTKHHEGRQLSVRNGASHYYCPVLSCERSLSNRRPFPRLGQLKQHYQRIHGVKGYTCPRCGKRFSLKDAHQRHVLECGKAFTCDTCEETFKTRNALYKHARRKGHALPEGSKPKPTSSISKTLPPPPPAPIIIRHVVRLPKMVSSSTQTEEVRSETQPSSSGQGISETSISNTSHHSFMDATLLNLSTQTDHRETFDFSDLATQTDQTTDFTKTEPGPEQSFDFSDLGTQTDLEIGSYFMSDLATQTDFILTTEHSFDLSHLETQTDFTQTEPGSAVEHSFDFSDLATQTDFTSFFDFGTQTAGHTASQSCQTASALHTASQACQTGHKPSTELHATEQVEEPSTIPGYDQLVEFGTQTFSTDDDDDGVLLGIATQTSPSDLCANFGSLEPRIDFGTQTIEELFCGYLSPVEEVADGQGHALLGHSDSTAQAEIPLIETNRVTELGGGKSSVTGGTGHVTGETGHVTGGTGHMTEGASHMTGGTGHVTTDGATDTSFC